VQLSEIKYYLLAVVIMHDARLGGSLRAFLGGNIAPFRALHRLRERCKNAQRCGPVQARR
jgi:hypothetical protein